jgi:hypothetical protein
MKLFSFLLIFLTAQHAFAQTTTSHQQRPSLPADSQLPQSVAIEYLSRDSTRTIKGLPGSIGFYDSLYQAPAPRRQMRAQTLTFPALLLGYGALSLYQQPLIKGNQLVQETLQQNYGGFESRLDNYTRYAPLVAVYGLNLAGIKGEHHLVDLSMLFVISSFMSRTATQTLKKYTRSQRPDASTFDSFPSQHTASAFAKAELLRLEFRGRSPWYGVAGYSFAIATGGLRMLNNRHWFSDVLAGAGVGILSTRVAYLVYPWLQQRIAHGWLKNMVLAPVYDQGNVGLSLLFRPGASPAKGKK